MFPGFLFPGLGAVVGAGGGVEEAGGEDDFDAVLVADDAADDGEQEVALGDAGHLRVGQDAQQVVEGLAERRR